MIVSVAGCRLFEPPFSSTTRRLPLSLASVLIREERPPPLLLGEVAGSTSSVLSQPSRLSLLLSRRRAQRRRRKWTKGGRVGLSKYHQTRSSAKHQISLSFHNSYTFKLSHQHQAQEHTPPPPTAATAGEHHHRRTPASRLPTPAAARPPLKCSDLQCNHRRQHQIPRHHFPPPFTRLLNQIHYHLVRFTHVVTDLRLLTQDLRATTLDLRFSSSDLRFLASDLRTLASDLRTLASDLRHPTPDL